MFAGQGNSLGFGGLTGGANPFGSNLSALSGPSGFAGNKPPIIGISAAKPFGAPAGEESEDADDSDSAGDDEGAEETGSGPEEAQKKDRHFHEQDGKCLGFRTPNRSFLILPTVETGEEGEKTIFSSRAKLYYFDKEWKERGGGMLKLNITRLRYNDSDSSEEDDTEATPTTRKARLIMRADGSHRVMLNTAIVKQSPLGGDERGSKPTGGSILLQGMIDGRDMPVSMQLKVCILFFTKHVIPLPLPTVPTACSNHPC
jgi:Ran-binding protein 3